VPLRRHAAGTTTRPEIYVLGLAETIESGVTSYRDINAAAT
jgi:hypothetical protein